MPTPTLGSIVLYVDGAAIVPAVISGTDLSHPSYAAYEQAIIDMGAEPGGIMVPGDPVPIPNTQGAGTVNLAVLSPAAAAAAAAYSVPFDDGESPADGSWHHLPA